jgi:hypothetical protein
VYSEGASLGDIGRSFPTQFTSSSIPNYREIHTGCMTLQMDTKQTKKAGDTSRRSIRRNQILGNFIPWKNRALKLLRMS